MAVTRWRALEDYHPAVRLMVRYKWRQEPPLLPSGFADRMGLPRQLVSRWLQVPAAQASEGVIDCMDAPLPSLTPPLAVRLARAIGLAPHELLLAAGLCTREEPLFAVEDVWELVFAHVDALLNQPGNALGLEREAALATVHERALVQTPDVAVASDANDASTLDNDDALRLRSLRTLLEAARAVDESNSA